MRLEYLLVPLVFGLGAPVAAMVGTSIGAGQRERALRVAWTGAAIAGGLTGAIGLAAALFPHAWLSLFGDDATMIAVGAQYLRIVGPFYGFFGVGLSLYFASQGAGRVGWAMGCRRCCASRSPRSAGLRCVRLGAGTGRRVRGAGRWRSSIYGIVNVAAVAAGVWFRQQTRRPRGRTGRDDRGRR